MATREDLLKEIARRELAKRQPQGQPSLARRALGVVARSPILPIAGSIAGGAGGPGAFLGAGTGEAARQLAQHAIGEGPGTSTEAAKRIAREAAFGGAGGYLGQGASRLVRAMAPEARRVFPGLINALQGIPEKSAESLLADPRGMAAMVKAGPKGLMREAVGFVQNVKLRLGGKLKSSNAEFGALKSQAIQATQGQKVIPIQDILVNTGKDAIEKGFIEGLSSTDRLGLSVINRFKKGITELGRKGQIGVEDALLLRKQVNQAMRNPKLGNDAKSVLLTFKTSLDEQLDGALGELGPKFRGILDEQSTIRGFQEDLMPVLERNTAPSVVAKNLEEGTALGARIEELGGFLGGNIIEPIRQAVRAIPLSADVVKGMTTGSSLVNVAKAPMGLLSRMPYAGRLFSPRATARLAGFVSEQAPRVSGAVTRGATTGLFGDNR